MRKLLYILLLASVCMSCRSIPPSTKTETEVNGTEDTNKKTTTNDSLNMLIYSNSVFLKNWASSTSFQFNKKDTYWSAPDSTGKQYPTSTSETTGQSTSQSHGKEQTEHNETIQLQQIRMVVDSLDRKINYLMKENKTASPAIPITVEKELSWWQTLFIWTGEIAWIVFFVVLVVWVSKKTRWLSTLWKIIKNV